MIARHKGTILGILVGLAFFAILAVVINRQTPRIDPVPTKANWAAPALATTTPTQSIVPEAGWWNEMPTPHTMPTGPSRLMPQQTSTPTTTLTP